MENAPDPTLKLKVTEGLGKDVGRSLARMDPHRHEGFRGRYW